MRNTVKLFVLIGSVLFSCGKNKEKEAVPYATDSTEISDTTQAKADDPAQQLSLVGVESEKIPFDEAKEYIYRYICDTCLTREFGKLSLGGVFKIADFFPTTITDTNQGVLMWYSYNLNLNTQYRLFLGSERMELSEFARLLSADDLNPTRALQYPVQPFLLDANLKPTRAGVATHFTRRYEPVASTPPTTPQGDLDRNFTALMSANRHPDGEPFNKKTFAYFQNNNDATVGRGTLTNLVNQAGAEYIRYYFGYHEGDSRQSVIRVILIATTARGQFLTGYVVQKSIPPSVTP